MKDIQSRLFAMQDTAYADLQSRLAPNIRRENCIGVRVPLLRAYAKELKKDPSHRDFLCALPHAYYDENMLHGLLLSEEKDYARCLADVDAFLPYVDNWAVCDVMSPKVFRKSKALLLPEIRRWAASPQVYICRFGLEMLMSHFLDADFRPELLDIPAAVVSEEYYVNMMLAWFFATALAKQWDATLPYLTEDRLGTWVHNKTIQKACESYRITDEQKNFLRTLRRKKEQA